ncbi:hypothetical protein F5Y16DRAFT_167760 [Xylariaceae sp. FL0255]|nr:hypothetical protein F5Y16DRAFT_167760 [Xylariaceae sp. FL0255]
MDLPTEIWHMILDEVPDKKTMSRLTRTCRFLRELGIPLLYRRFETFTWDLHGGQSQYQSLSAFIRTISTNRQLANVVTEMSCVTSAYTKHYDREDLFGKYSQYDSALVGDVARRLRVPIANIRMTSGALWGISSTTSFAHQLLVCSLPNLRTLELKVPSSSEGFNQCLSIWAKAPSNRLWNLTVLKIEEESIARRFNLAEVQDLIRYSPNLEYLSLKRCYSITADYDLGLCNLRQLRIVESRLHREGLTLCRYCSRLEHFTYVSFGPHWAVDRMPAEIVVALRPARQTLRRLEIFNFSRDGPRELHQGIESLREFEVLETVTLNPGALVSVSDNAAAVDANGNANANGNGNNLATNGNTITAFTNLTQTLQDLSLSPSSSPSSGPRGLISSKLPTSLKHLTLVNVSRHLYPAIIELSQSCAEGHFPNLKTVSVSGGPPNPRPGEDWGVLPTEALDVNDRKVLRGLFEKVSVEFKGQTGWWGRLRGMCDMPV